MTLAVLVLALCGCQPWKVTRQGDANPLAGKTSFGLQWLEWSGVFVDAIPEDAWLANHQDWQKDWAGNKSVGSEAFRKGVADGLEGSSLTLLKAPDPTGASVMLKATVQELDTGGWQPTRVKISVQVMDGKGVVLEAISLTAKSKNDGVFETRLGEASTTAGTIVARYLKKGTGL